MNLRVYRATRVVGTLDMHDSEPFYGFTYDHDYLASKDAMPLSLSLPLRSERFSGAETLPFFEGLLPEGDVRAVVARQFHVSMHSPAQLLRVLGRDCAGDVMVVEEDDSQQPFAEGDYLLLEEGLVCIAEHPFEEISVLRAKHRLSLAGGQEKIALYHDNAQSLDAGWYVPLNGSPSNYIIKPQVLDRFPQLALNEFLCMKAACALGIEVAKASLLYPASPLLLVERYDRRCRGVQSVDGLELVERVHQEDFCQALGRSSEEKYETDKSSYAREMAGLMRNYAEVPPVELRRLLTLMTYNYIVGNCDAHLKNFSLMWVDADSVRLAPAYDLVSTAIYDGRFGGQLSRGMGIRVGEHLNIDKVSSDDFEALVHDLNLSKRVFHEIVEHFSADIEGAFEAAGEEAVALGFDARDITQRILLGAKKRLRVLG